MKVISFVGIFVLAYAPLAVLGAEPTDGPDAKRIIPLKEIWAYKMPGTRNLEEFEEYKLAKLIDGIRKSLSADSKHKMKLKTGFAVQGERVEALRAAHEVLVNGGSLSPRLSHRREISVVFFSQQSGYYVRLHEVVRHGRSIEIRYRIIPHKSLELTEHFALIPLGILPPGGFQVNIEQTPLEENHKEPGSRPVKLELAQSLVCKSFSFVVE
jgi:hypothetical protein